MTRTGTETYYEHRATEYDNVYAKPERQADIRVIEASLRGAFAGLDVLDVAAGTAYWTQFFAHEARSVVATDLNDTVLAVARARRTWPTTVSFVNANAFELHEVGGLFNAAFLGFFWSHLTLAQLDPFLEHLCGRPARTLRRASRRRAMATADPHVAR